MSNYSIPDFTVHSIGDIQTLSQIYPQNIKDLNIPKLWSKTKGKNVTVMVLDTGCPFNHSDFGNNIDLTKCRSFISDEDIYDMHVGHGTHCAGTIGAADNSEGIVGIAPEVTLVTGKVLNKDGFNERNSIDLGLAYCLELKPDIINMSLGGPIPMPSTHELIKQLTSQNITVVCSAGNNGQDHILFPAQYDECIAVGSYNTALLKERSKFSSYGESLDIMAPGEKILSTYLNNQYAVLSGTSMSAPVVSGVIALIISYFKTLDKTLTLEEIKQLLYNNAIDMSQAGRDLESGFGIINPEMIFEKINIVK